MTTFDQSIVNLVAAPQASLKERLFSLLDALHPALRADVIRAMEGESKLLYQPAAHSDPSRPAPLAGTWALTTFLIAQYVAPDVDPARAGNVAIAVECFVCAIDLLDDVIDGDQTTTFQALGQARTLNVSTALLLLAHQAILSLFQPGSDPQLMVRLLDTFEQSALVTAAGQHRDILSEQQPIRDYTREECLDIAAAKAGSIMRLACRLGAMTAGADDELCEQLSEIGELLGISHQLDNDAHDLYHLLQGEQTSQMLTNNQIPAHSVKTDLERGKKTLPIVLAAKDNAALQRIAELTDEEKQEHLQAFHEAIMTTWGMCLLYRERARERMQALETRKPVALALRILLGLT